MKFIFLQKSDLIEQNTIKSFQLVKTATMIWKKENLTQEVSEISDLIDGLKIQKTSP